MKEKTTKERAPSQTVAALLAAGIAAKDYTSAPKGIGKDVFVISVQPTTPAGVILVNEGRAKIKVATDKERKQAVLHIHEPPREISRDVVHTMSPIPARNKKAEKPTTHTCEERLLSRFQQGVTLPAGMIEYSYVNLTCKWQRDENSSYGAWVISGKVTAKIGQATRQNLLLGMDETAHFIAGLPKKCKTVQAAHDALKPKEAKAKGTVRQGEWFFVPVSEAFNKILDAYSKVKQASKGWRGSPGYQPTHRAFSRPLEQGSSHHARQGMMYRNQMYVIGYVEDRRSNHHNPLHFTTWHKVVRNKEQVVRDPERKVAMRTRSWD